MLCEIVIQTAWKVGKDGIEAGTNLVPVSLVFMLICSSFSKLAKLAGLTIDHGIKM